MTDEGEAGDGFPLFPIQARTTPIQRSEPPAEVVRDGLQTQQGA